MNHVITSADSITDCLRGSDLLGEIGGIYLHYEGGTARYRSTGTCVDYAQVVWMSNDGSLLFNRPSYLPDVYAEICVDDDPVDDYGNLVDDDAHRDELYDAIYDMLVDLGIPSEKIPDDLLGKAYF